MAGRDREKQKRKARRNGLIAGIAVAGLGFLIFPFSALGAVLIAGAGALTGTVVGIMSEGLDLTTHNREDHPVAFDDLPLSGDEHTDEIIRKGAEALKQLREANEAIKDKDLSDKIYAVEDKCVSIFRTIAEKPAKSAQIRKFMNYYLPTTQKMLASYQTMQERGISQDALREHRETLSRGLDMVNTACQKQLDNLFKETQLDISTDIDVLEQMLKRDGYVEGDLSGAAISSAAKAAITAAAAQMAAGEDVPLLVVPGTENAGHSPAAKAGGTVDLPR